MQKTAVIVAAQGGVIHTAQSRWPSKIKALLAFIRLIRAMSKLVDKAP
jgi:hypothetical protein